MAELRREAREEAEEERRVAGGYARLAAIGAAAVRAGGGMVTPAAALGAPSFPPFSTGLQSSGMLRTPGHAFGGAMHPYARMFPDASGRIPPTRQSQRSMMTAPDPEPSPKERTAAAVDGAAAAAAAAGACTSTGPSLCLRLSPPTTTARAGPIAAPRSARSPRAAARAARTGESTPRASRVPSRRSRARRGTPACSACGASPARSRMRKGQRRVNGATRFRPEPCTRIPVHHRAPGRLHRIARTRASAMEACVCPTA